MQRIPRDLARKYAFDWRDEPLLRVAQGEIVEVETFDASTGYFKTPADKAVPALRPGFDRDPPLVNPIAGPIFVEGAQRGDAPGNVLNAPMRCMAAVLSNFSTLSPKLPLLSGSGLPVDDVDVAAARRSTRRRSPRSRRGPTSGSR